MTDFRGYVTGKGQEWLSSVWIPFLDALSNAVSALEGSAAVTSTESVTIGTGAKSWASVAPDSPFPVGAAVRAYSASDPAKYMIGAVTASSGSLLSIEATIASGSGAVSDWVINAAFDQGFLRTSGGAVSGDLARSGAAETLRQFLFQTAGQDRFKIRVNADPESGSGAGSDFEIVACDDSGAEIGAPLSINRATGTVSFGAEIDAGGYVLSRAALTGTRMPILDLGDVSGTVSITADSGNFITATLTGNTTFDFTSLPSHEFARRLRLVQAGDPTPFSPTWHVDSAGTNVKHRKTRPDYANQDLGTVTWVTVESWGGELHVWETEEETF